MTLQSSDKFEPAKPEDGPRLSRIAKSSKAHWGYPAAWLKLWDADLTLTPEYIQANGVYKLVRNDRIIGCSAIEHHPDYYEVGHLWLLPEFIGLGLGKALLWHALQNEVPPGSRVKIISDLNATAFYQSQGFFKVGDWESQPSGRFLPVMEANMPKG